MLHLQNHRTFHLEHIRVRVLDTLPFNFKSPKLKTERWTIKYNKTLLQICLICISMWLEIKGYGSSQNPAPRKRCCAALNTQPSLSKLQFPLSRITMLTSNQRYWRAYANGSIINRNPFERPPN